MSAAPRTIVITGAAGGLGRALAHRFGAEPSTALVLSDVSEAGLEAARGELGSAATVEAIAADVGEAADVDALVDATVSRFDRLDVMINNAGMLSPNARMHNLSAEDWARAVRVNLMGVVHGITAAVRVMRERGGGAIISTASISGLTAWPYAAPYGASKAAVIHLTKIAAAEYARDGIRVNCVCPGSFASAMQDELPDGALETLAEKHPLGLGTAEDLVGAFAYLASDEARWTTGATLVVDGGYTIL
jgi:NAD(P)-dependent dehydrogenase (short-subunit alcohol dehydrogenase family)